MSVHYDFKVEEPKKLMMTLTITMTLSEWQKLTEQQLKTDAHPSWEIENAVRAMTRLASEHFGYDPNEQKRANNGTAP